VPEDQTRSRAKNLQALEPSALNQTFYEVLEVAPRASVQEIRRAYREKSKIYHPDTTVLADAIAREKFQHLNEAYAVLSSPERRLIYDQQIGVSRIPVIRPLPPLSSGHTGFSRSSSAYLDPNDRPLSSGEIFALFILGLTFLGCLLLAVLVGFNRGEVIFRANMLPQLPNLVRLAQPSPKPSGALLAPVKGSVPKLIHSEGTVTKRANLKPAVSKSTSLKPAGPKPTKLSGLPDVPTKKVNRSISSSTASLTPRVTPELVTSASPNSAVRIKSVSAF
jgi:hypothetical protein